MFRRTRNSATAAAQTCDATTTTDINTKTWVFGFDKKSTKKQCCNKKSRKSLCQSLQGNKSIDTVCIGPLVDEQVLPLLLETVFDLPNLKVLQLQLSVAFVPLKTIMQMAKCKKLERLEITETWINLDKDDAESSHFNFARLIPHLSSLQTLKIEDCGLDDDQIAEMYKYLATDKTSKCLKELSLARNWRITWLGYGMLCCLGVLRLDLSECDIDSRSIRAISDGFFGNDCMIQDLDLNFNPNALQDPVINQEFFKAACSQLRLLNASFCGLHHGGAVLTLFRQLKQQPKASIEYLSVHEACPLQEDVQDLLDTNKRLKCLLVQDPKLSNNNNTSKNNNNAVGHYSRPKLITRKSSLSVSSLIAPRSA